MQCVHRELDEVQFGSGVLGIANNERIVRERGFTEDTQERMFRKKLE